jgi:hypothetical protein
MLLSTGRPEDLATLIYEELRDYVVSISILICKQYGVFKCRLAKLRIFD